MEKDFIVIGDTHGNHKLIVHRIKSLKLRDFNMFHVGDFGVGFEKDINDDILQLKALNKELVKANCYLNVIRGNHDDPKFFTGEYDLSNLKMLPDYSVVEIGDEKILMVGGAISIDRVDRKRKMLFNELKSIDHPTYWYDEAFNLDENKLKEFRGIDYVITHSSPQFVFPLTKTGFDNYIALDPKLIDDLNKERLDLEIMYNILSENNKIKKYFYGHFHKQNSEYYNDTNFVCLKIDEFYFKR